LRVVAFAFAACFKVWPITLTKGLTSLTKEQGGCTGFDMAAAKTLLFVKPVKALPTAMSWQLPYPTLSTTLSFVLTLFCSHPQVCHWDTSKLRVMGALPPCFMF
jgi:hypothetical protein